MALVQYGGGILGMRGSVGGQVHSRNRFGNYVRARTVPVNPQSARQSVVRAVVASLAAAWSDTLTVAQRAAWEVYANAITFTNKLGEQVKLTGFNHFVRSNSFNLQNGGTIVVTGPVVLTLPAEDPTLAATVVATTQALSIVFDSNVAWVNTTGGLMGVYMSAPQSAGTTFIKGPWRKAGTVLGDGTTPPTSPAAMTAPFSVGAGQVVGVRARILDADGRLSGLFQVGKVVAS